MLHDNMVGKNNTGRDASECTMQVFCQHVQALPDWSQSTLQAHLSDPRPHLKSDEQLDKGETGDAIWDAAQYQLALTGTAVHIPTLNCIRFQRYCTQVHTLMLLAPVLTLT